MWNKNFQIFRLGLEKTEDPEIKFPKSTGSLKKQGSSRKTFTSALLTMPKLLTVWIIINYGKFLKTWEYQTTLPASLYAGQEATVRTVHVKTDWSKIEEDVHQGWTLAPTYLTYMQSASCAIPSWMKHKLESRFAGEITITSDDTTLMAQSEEELKTLLMKVKEKSEKAGLKFNIQKTKITTSSPITSWQIDGKTMETVTLFTFLSSKITAGGDCSHEIKDSCSMEEKLWKT